MLINARKRLQQYPVKMSCKTWVAARVTKEGKFADEETQKKAEEIVSACILLKFIVYIF